MGADTRYGPPVEFAVRSWTDGYESDFAMRPFASTQSMNESTISVGRASIASSVKSTARPPNR